MNKQQARKVFWKVAIVVILFGTSLNFWYKPDTVTTQVASGYVDSKRAVDYSCGSAKSPSTCTDYILEVAGKEHTVNHSTFNSTFIGSNVTLTTTSPAASALIDFYKSVSSLIVLIWFCLELLWFLYWFLFCNTKLSYRAWRRSELC